MVTVKAVMEVDSVLPANPAAPSNAPPTLGDQERDGPHPSAAEKIPSNAGDKNAPTKRDSDSTVDVRVWGCHSGRCAASQQRAHFRIRRSLSGSCHASGSPVASSNRSPSRPASKQLGSVAAGLGLRTNDRLRCRPSIRNRTTNANLTRGDDRRSWMPNTMMS